MIVVDIYNLHNLLILAVGKVKKNTPRNVKIRKNLSAAPHVPVKLANEILAKVKVHLDASLENKFNCVFYRAKTSESEGIVAQDVFILSYGEIITLSPTCV